MKKIILIIVINFFYINQANAGYEGSGKIILNETVLKYFKEYLDTKNHNTNEGANRHGKGWYFFVAISGEEFGYSYCAQGRECVLDPIPARKACLKNVKKYLKRTEKCFLFAHQRYIKWGGQKIRIPNKSSSDEIEDILRDHGFID